MYTISVQRRLPLMTDAERRLATRLVDRWDEVWPSLRDRPTLYRACERLLQRYGQDMLRRIEGLSESSMPSPAAIPPRERQRHCDLVMLGRLLARTEAA